MLTTTAVVVCTPTLLAAIRVRSRAEIRPADPDEKGEAEAFDDAGIDVGRRERCCELH